MGDGKQRNSASREKPKSFQTETSTNSPPQSRGQESRSNFGRIDVLIGRVFEYFCFTRLLYRNALGETSRKFQGHSTRISTFITVKRISEKHFHFCILYHLLFDFFPFFFFFTEAQDEFCQGSAQTDNHLTSGTDISQKAYLLRALPMKTGDSSSDK